MKALTLEQAQEFVDFLTGNALPESFTFRCPPTLTAESAFAVVYYLQECLSVIPDTFEMCRTCELLFDTDEGGFTIDGSSEPDEWHQNHGVTRKMLLTNDGAHFCSEQCEARFWRSQET